MLEGHNNKQLNQKGFKVTNYCSVLFCKQIQFYTSVAIVQ